jgi:hypothetical protein
MRCNPEFVLRVFNMGSHMFTPVALSKSLDRRRRQHSVLTWGLRRRLLISCSARRVRSLLMPRFERKSPGSPRALSTMAEVQWAAADYGSLILLTPSGGHHASRAIMFRRINRNDRARRRRAAQRPSANLLRSKAINADPWVIGLRRRRPSLGVAVALTNKTARIGPSSADQSDSKRSGGTRSLRVRRSGQLGRSQGDVTRPRNNGRRDRRMIRNSAARSPPRLTVKSTEEAASGAARRAG